jgi:hypothetical protein
MKKYLWILLLIPSLCFSATGDLQTIGGKVDTAITSIAGKAGTAIATICGKNYTDGDAGVNTTDMSRGFETPETERADDAKWTETDTGSLLDDVDATQAHSGTNSMSVAFDGDTDAYQTYDIGSNKTDISISFWFYTGAGPEGDVNAVIGSFGQAVGTTTIRVYYQKASGVYHFGLRGTSFCWGDAGVTANNWYRLEVDVTQNNTSTLYIYNAAGAEVDNVSCTANDNGVRYLFFGHIGSSPGWSTFYFDDLGIDYTDATTPLSPFTVAD